MSARSRLFAVTTALLAWHTPASADAFETCRTTRSAEQRLSACTEVVANAQSTPGQKAVAYRHLGRLRAEAGALEAALADLNAALQRDADDDQAYLTRAQVRMARGDVAGAIADFTAVIRLRPTLAVGYSGRGHAYLVQRDAARARADFEQALRIVPNSASAYNNRGLAHRAAGDLDQAIADYTAAIALNPIYALAYNNRGYAHEARGRPDDAIADFRQALLIDPALAGARDGLARLGAASAIGPDAVRLVGEGRRLVETHCSACHAIGPTGSSTNPRAPTFQSLHARYPMQALREPLTRGIAAPHDEMPKFRLADTDIDMIVAYINSLAARR